MKQFIVLSLIAAAAWAQAPAPEETPNLPKGLYAVFVTSKGNFTAKLYEKDTPIAVQTFVGLAQGTKPWRDPRTGAMVTRPLYNNITFHRVLTDEMIQAGDPTATGAHNCGIRIRDEFLPGLTFDHAGKLAMANTGQPDSGGCQFFITAAPVREWNQHYTIFGEVVAGQEVVNQISHVALRGDRPADTIRLMKVTIERVGPEPKKKK